ncbi:hypothetical protein ACHAW6_013526 [Cyclotella cf. meneghiniana]
MLIQMLTLLGFMTTQKTPSLNVLKVECVSSSQSQNVLLFGYLSSNLNWLFSL